MKIVLSLLFFGMAIVAGVVQPPIIRPAPRYYLSPPPIRFYAPRIYCKDSVHKEQDNGLSSSYV